MPNSVAGCREDVEADEPVCAAASSRGGEGGRGTDIFLDLTGGGGGTGHNCLRVELPICSMWPNFSFTSTPSMLSRFGATGDEDVLREPLEDDVDLDLDLEREPVIEEPFNGDLAVDCDPPQSGDGDTFLSVGDGLGEVDLSS